MGRSTLGQARLAILALSFAAACGSSSFDGGVFRNEQLAFRVGPMPDGWHRIETDAALLAFRSDDASATIAVNGRCGLDGDDVPLEALTHHLFIHFRARELIEQKHIDLDGRAALRSELTAELDGVDKHYVVYVLKKDGCVYDFMHVSPNGAGAGAFERFVQGFRTLP